MKKIIRNISILLITAFLWSINSCKGKEIEKINTLKNEVLELEEKIKNLEQQARESDDQGKIELPVGLISVDEAKEMEQRYVRTTGAILNRALGYEDNREFLFPVERLKKYITYFENHAKEKGYENLGLRIYLSTYSKAKPKTSATTVFIAPTATNVKAKGASKLVETSDNIYSIEALNLAGSGRPPSSYN